MPQTLEAQGAPDVFVGYEYKHDAQASERPGSMFTRNYEGNLRHL